MSPSPQSNSERQSSLGLSGPQGRSPRLKSTGETTHVVTRISSVAVTPSWRSSTALTHTQDATSMRFAYLHGFASGIRATKGLAAQAAAQRAHTELAMLELNQPDFAHLTVSAALKVVDEFASIDDEPLAMIGSSLGGYIATLWASQNPGRVVRLLLLCPGFGLAQRWPSLMGEEAFARWEQQGHALFDDALGTPTPVHWGFIQDIRTFDPAPAPTCPTRIIHGRQDDVVPFESSLRYTQEHPLAKLIEVDDDHRLTSSLELVTRATTQWLIHNEEISTTV